MRKAIFSKQPVRAGPREKKEGEGQWRCAVFPEGPLQLRTSDLEMNETETLGHTDSPSPGGAGTPESRGDFSHHPSQFRAAVSGTDAPRQVLDRPPAHTHRRPLRRSPLGPAPPPPRPGRAPLPLPGAEAPGPAEWVSACPRARAEARPPSLSPLRAPELRWEPPRAERPESSQPRAAPGLPSSNLPVPPRPACSPVPPRRPHTRVPTPSLHRTSLSLSLKQCSLPPSVGEQASLLSDKQRIFQVTLLQNLVGNIDILWDLGENAVSGLLIPYLNFNRIWK